MLECPVTGGVHKAAEGDITVLVGGDEAIFESHRDLLSAVGQPILYMGPLGSASVIKVITNMLAFINLVAVGEALMLAKRGGLDLALGLLQDGADRGVIGRVVRHRGRRRRVFNSGEEKMISLQFSFACKKGNKKTLFSLSLFLSRTDSLEEVEDNGKKKGKR